MIQSPSTLSNETCAKIRNGFLIDIVVIFIMNTICAGSYLAGLMQYAGVSEELVGLITAVPVMAAVFQVLGAAIVGAMPNKKRAVCLSIGAHRVLMALFFLIPVFFGNTRLSQLLTVVAYTVGHFAQAFGTPAFSTLLVRVTPEEIRSSYLSRRERYGLIAAAIAALVGSYLLDELGLRGLQRLAFLVIGLLLLVGAVINVLAICRMDMPTRGTVKRVSIVGLTAPLREPGYRKVIWLLILWQVANQCWSPFNGVYLLNSMHVSYTLLGVVVVICSFEKALLVKYWGRFVSHTSWEIALTWTMAVYAVSTLMYLLITPDNVGWMFITQQIVGNIAWSFLGIGLFNIQCRYIADEDKSVHLGVGAAISGMAGFLATMAATPVYAAVNRAGWFLNGQQVLAVVGAGCAVVIVVLLYRGFVRPMGRV